MIIFDYKTVNQNCSNNLKVLLSPLLDFTLAS